MVPPCTVKVNDGIGSLGKAKRNLILGKIPDINTDINIFLLYIYIYIYMSLGISLPFCAEEGRCTVL
jgi:hypothetical protein